MEPTKSVNRRWVNTKKRLPKNNEYVLLELRNPMFANGMVVNSYSEGSDQDSKWFVKTYKAWQPLPKPYKN